MVKKTITKEELFNVIAQIPDPEIPVLSIGELGILRNIEMHHDKVVVVITPTYSGCPAMKFFEQEILSVANEAGISHVEIKTVYSPAWTTDWISDAAKIKLKEYGIAPPQGTSDKSFLFGQPKKINCPKCHSENTELKSQFGSTSCKALYFCKQCTEPFEYFKCI